MDILCVDDDADFLDLTVTYLQRKLPAATIHTATRVGDAETLIETEPIACVVSDYEMPDRNGLQFLQTVRETHADLPFILFTGKGSEEIASEAISAGVTDYLQKRGPEQYDRLASRIRHAVAEYRTEHDLRERVKELTAIQSISDLLSDSDGRITEQLEQVVTYLPQSVQFPEAAVASLSIDDTEFTSPEYESPDHQYTVQNVTLDGTEVVLSIGYTTDSVTEANAVTESDAVTEANAEGKRDAVTESDAVPKMDSDVFLPEERELFSTILQLVTGYLDRRHVLSDLQEADRRLTLILENTTAVMYLKDTAGRYVFVNAEYERLFDIDSATLVGKSDTDVHPPEMAESVGANDRRALETGEAVEVEEQVTVNGESRTYLSLKVPARDAAGNVEGVFGVSTEITERKERERQLEALNRVIPRLLSAETPEEVAEYGVDAAREILGLEANAIHLYDAETEELAPVAYTDAVLELIGEPPAFREGESIAWRVFVDGTATSIDDVQADADAYNSDSPIRSELHLPLGEFGILMAGSPTTSDFGTQDVTVGELLATHLTTALQKVTTERTLRERESELQAQNERLEQFASMVSHDLRNPLAIASGNLELYRETGDGSHLETIETALSRIEELITDLTTLARHGIPDEDHEPVSVAGVARRAWELLDTQSATLETGPCTVLGDESHLTALFENLFRNAIGHGGDDVTVRVGPLPHGFYVEDTGDGIPPDERDDVFEHGYTTGYGGSGIGLTIVSRIAQVHDWDITVTDSKEGGARFEFRDTDPAENTTEGE